MKVRLLKKLRKEMHKNLTIIPISSTVFSENILLRTYINKRYYGIGKVCKIRDTFSIKELEHIVLKDYINIKKYKK